MNSVRKTDSIEIEGRTYNFSLNPFLDGRCAVTLFSWGKSDEKSIYQTLHKAEVFINREEAETAYAKLKAKFLV